MALHLGPCDICRNRAELAPYSDGRQICGDCMEAMLAGEARRGLTQPEPAPLDPPPPSSEREAYLATINKATPVQINKIVRRLVRERVFHVEFDQIVRNERWFSLMDLRRIALEVDSRLKSCSHPTDKVRKRRSKPCQSQPPQIRTKRRNRTRNRRPIQHPLPSQSQQLLSPLPQEDSNLPDHQTSHPSFEKPSVQ